MKGAGRTPEHREFWDEVTYVIAFHCPWGIKGKVLEYDLF